MSGGEKVRKPQCNATIYFYKQGGKAYKAL